MLELTLTTIKSQISFNDKISKEIKNSSGLEILEEFHLIITK